MTKEELSGYLDHLAAESARIEYIERHFTAAKDDDVVDLDFDLGLSGRLRDREPTLPDILKHPRVVILGEPGAGKSLVAHAAVLELIRSGDRIPIFSELKHYRGDLATLLKSSAPAGILNLSTTIETNSIVRAYVLDGPITREFSLTSAGTTKPGQVSGQIMNAWSLLLATEPHGIPTCL